ncbi:uncharacterized protein LOC136096666 [Hydra vulgaris]|uniref:uncharacterized protein LOC136096666 n=1 Tax=Hydra vulgaris TaxID=6087 RepID=UPI0032EA3CF9
MVNLQLGDFNTYKCEQETIIVDLKKLIETLRTDNANLTKRVLDLENSKSKSSSAVTAPYIVVLNDKLERNSVLKNAKELKKDKTYESVFINPDLTESERYKSKLLREECKKLNNDYINKANFYFVNFHERKKCDLSINKEHDTQKCSELMIWYTNATSLNNKIDELRLQCEIYKPDVICVTETWFKAESVVNIISYNIFRSDRKTHGGGVCIYVKQCINQFETSNLQLNNNFIKQIWTCICFKNNKMLIGCIYRPPDIPHEYNNYVLLSINAAKMSIYQKEYSDLFITGDFNYNTIDWSDNNCPFSATDNESQTNKFIECLEDCFLFQCVCEPTFQIANYKSTNTLDLIITNDKNKIVSITHSAPLGNVKQGHHLLKCCYLMNDYKFSTKHKKSNRLYQKGNYELFSCHSNSVDWENGYKSKSINEMYDLFLYHYNYATNLFIPRINYQNRRNRNKWITPELKHKVRTKNNIWLANKRNGWNEESTKIQYNKLKIRIKNDIKNNIKQFESTLASKFKSNPKLLYKYINEKKSVKTHIRALEIDNGEIINDQFAIATELNKYFHSVYVDNNCTNIIEFHNIPSNLLLNTVLITQNDVQTRLQALDKSKSVGFDFVHPYILMQLVNIILIIFNFQKIDGNRYPTRYVEEGKCNATF